MTADRMTVNQVVQVGTESPIGTGTSASKLLRCFNWTMGIETDVMEFRPTGHKYTTVTGENMEWGTWSIDGPLDYAGIIYPLSNIYGAPTPSLQSPSTTVYSWDMIPNVMGINTPTGFVIQQGDANYAHQFNYCLLTDFTYKATPKTFDLSCKGFCQKIQNSITMTSNPTTISNLPMVPQQITVSLDPTSAALGTTNLTRFLSIDFSSTGNYGPFWTLQHSNAGTFEGHADLAPKVGGKILVEADTNGMNPLRYLQAGTTYYMRVDSSGPTIDATHSKTAHFQHDMAIHFVKSAPFKDDQGLYAIEWDFTVVEDASWNSGQSMKFHTTNLQSAL
jgi:hypothetical protein